MKRCVGGRGEGVNGEEKRAELEIDFWTLTPKFAKISL